MDKLAELQSLLDKLSQSKVNVITRDLHFDWSNPATLKSGQLDVLLKRLRLAAAKTIGDYDEAADQSPDIQAMRTSLENLRRNINEHSRNLDV